MGLCLGNKGGGLLLMRYCSGSHSSSVSQLTSVGLSRHSCGTFMQGASSGEKNEGSAVLVSSLVWVSPELASSMIS